MSNSPSFPHLEHHWTTGSFCCAHPSVTQSPSPPSQALFFFDFSGPRQVDDAVTWPRGGPNTTGEQPPFDKPAAPREKKKKRYYKTRLYRATTLATPDSKRKRDGEGGWLWIAWQVWKNCWDVFGEYEAILFVDGSGHGWAFGIASHDCMQLAYHLPTKQSLP